MTKEEIYSEISRLEAIYSKMEKDLSKTASVKLEEISTEVIKLYAMRDGYQIGSNEKRKKWAKGAVLQYG